MDCEFEYCVYNKENRCHFNEIAITELGMCDSCEIVTIPEEELRRYKEARLNRIKEMWGDDL